MQRVNEWKQNALFAIVGLLILVFGVHSLSAEVKMKAVCIVVLGSILVLGFSWLLVRDVREMLSARREKARLGVPARVRLEMPYHELAARFHALAGVDELAGVYLGCLSWKSQSFGDILIRRTENEEWMALYWVRSDWHYTDTQLRQICKAAAPEMPEEFKKAKAHGLIIYSKGELSIYPEAHRKQVEDAFMDNIFLPTREEFTAWLAEYAEEG